MLALDRAKGTATGNRSADRPLACRSLTVGGGIRSAVAGLKISLASGVVEMRQKDNSLVAARKPPQNAYHIPQTPVAAPPTASRGPA